MDSNTTILVDTNVWLDYYALNRAGGAEAAELLGFAFSHGIKLLYQADIIKDVFYLVSATTKRIAREEKGALSPSNATAANEFAWSAVNHMRENAFAISIGQSDVWYAAKMRGVHGDFEDNLVLAAAERANATYLVTNDEQLIKHAPVTALTPHDALVYLRAKMQ